MQRKLNLIIVVITALCLLMSSTLMTLTGRSSGGVLGAGESRPNSMWIDTSNLNVSVSRVGQEFNVTVWAEGVTNVAAWQVHMFYNDTLINVTNWFEPAGDPQYLFAGKTTSMAPTPPDDAYYHVDPDNASIEVGGILLPTVQSPVSGTGKLCIIQFEVKVLPTENQQIVSTLGINTSDTYLLDPDIKELPGVTKYDASVTLTLGPPQFTFLGMEWWAWTIIVVIAVIILAVAVVLFRRTRGPARKVQGKPKEKS